MEATHWIRLIGACWVAMMMATPKGYAKKPEKPLAQKGIIDLSSWKPELDGSISLDGEWESYKGSIINYKLFHDDLLKPEKEYEKLPAIWKVDSLNTHSSPAFGYATYRLIIKNPLQPPGTQLALSLSNYLSSYELWVDDKLVARNGKVGKTLQATVHQWLPQVVSFELTGEDTELTLYVANFKHRKGGVSVNPIIGTPQGLNRLRMFDILIHAFLMGSYFLMGALFVGLFLYWKEDKSIIYFAAFCLIFAYRFFAIGPRINVYLFPDLFTFDLALRLEYLTVYLGVPLIVTYIGEMFPRTFSRTALRLFQGVSALCAFLVIAMPVRIFTELAVPFTLFMVLLSFYGGYVVIQAARKKEEGSYVSLVGLIAGSSLLFVASGDYLGWFPGVKYATELGVLVFIISLAFVVARRFTNFFFEQKKMSEKTREQKEEIENETEVLEQVRERMAAITLNLENEITNRTQKLRNAYSELASVNKELDLFLYRYSHDLRSPLTTLMGLNEVAKTSIKERNARQLFTHVNLTVVKMDNLVRKLMTLHLINNNQREAPDNMSLQVVIDESLDLYRQQIIDKKIQIKGSFNKLPMISTNITLLKIVVENVLENAIHFTHKNPTETPVIKIDAEMVEGDMVLRVRDNGSGINEESLPLVFDMFFRGSAASQGSGLGLYLANKSVEKLEGSIHLTSTEGEYTEVVAHIPATLAQ